MAGDRIGAAAGQLHHPLGQSLRSIGGDIGKGGQNAADGWAFDQLIGSSIKANILSKFIIPQGFHCQCAVLREAATFRSDVI